MSEAIARSGERDKRTQFNFALNGYRGLCALAVFAYHVGNAGILAWPSGTLAKDLATAFWSSMKYGVEMFFMISGFVILGSLLRHERVSGFLVDRVIRIFSGWIPAVVAVAAVCLVFRMEVFAHTAPFETVVIFFANLFLLPPLVPLPMVHTASWSLTYEWMFYLTAALGAISARRAPGQAWTTAVWALPAAVFVCLYPRALFFVTGVIVFVHREWFGRHASLLKFPLVSLVVFLLAWRSTGANRAELSDTLIDFAADGRWIPLLIALVASIHMFASVTLNASRQFAFLSNRTFQFLGNISYSFYLWHIIVMAVVKRVATAFIAPDAGPVAAFWFFTVASLAVALPVSWISWRLFETHMASWVRQAVKRRASIGSVVRA